ncbi:hypothetical protein SPBR_08485 [Sporothrix brasiliensis 5110]|uniref:R3H domain-containing protein n=1 Tax=Sporothrix brasiliensis 5110 TaxID=1398154 RepID=A0A0C2F6H4_9PEZI|nr:uncharacterized protein SPBR_08485 [Sporothrix brasiliensis 5110]KIH86598.1 hypothetical protein SPBR_08485 [Sporothrix brasiliensis 5110]
MATAFERGPPVELEEKLQHTEEWTRSILESLGMSSDARGTGGEPLTIPLDEPVQPRQRKLVLGPVIVDSDDESDGPVAPRATLMKRRHSQRDSQRHRDALLKGKEGSRQRRRWENDRLLHVPNAQPPLPSDWEVHPTHTVHYNLPYHVAQFWDRGLREMVNERRAAEAVLRRQQLVAQQSGTAASPRSSSKKSPKKASKKAKASGSPKPTSPSPTFGMVTRDLRQAVKKSETIKLWVRALEEPVRQYVFAAEAARRALEGDEETVAAEASPSLEDDVGSDMPSDPTAASDTYAVSDEDDDELVFVGRRTVVEKEAQASWKRVHREVGNNTVDSGILFDALGDGETGSFKRWIAHSLSDYYGLTSQSTNIDASNRVVYVSLRDEAIRSGAGPILIPRPMWELFEAA